MALTVRATLCAAAVSILLGGCQSGKWGPSEQWRLQNLEEKALTFQNGQMSQNERLDALERRLDALGASGDSGAVVNATTMPEEKPLLSAVDLHESAPDAKAPAAPAAPAPKADTAASWDAYPAVKNEVPAPDAKATATPAPKAKPAAKAPAKPAPAAKKAKASSTAKSLYDSALGQLLAGQTKPAREKLESFLKSYPRHPLAPNARYWLGETYYHEKRYPEAVVAFKEVHRLHPRHEKAAAALLKLGYSYAQLGDRDNARFYLDVLVQDYPKSEPATLARKRLKAMK
ncbi:tol-pal system protein YbgF [Desulfobaculum xiamenense]|uniref:Tol-pal system protein YbgF n=1 Tax=Desulfobaculum xiamenense TaxID=995050 RepID=A0A846QKF9_9BACT|nr:tol-pal system protein YbgF [Desulfobaculum xiamenense]NJB69416.1 tol-pal system protein YbgF [Desulfobaculum xiamenense]